MKLSDDSSSNSSAKPFVTGAQPPAGIRTPINRWVLAGAGVLMQLALGAVYAWSVFRDPLVKGLGWSISEVTFTFSIAILVLGFAAFFGGLWMRRVGPRTVGIVAGICYGVGVALSSLSASGIWVLYLSFGVLGGLGLGLGYIAEPGPQASSPDAPAALDIVVREL